MFYTFSSSDHQYIIEADIRQEAFDKIKSFGEIEYKFKIGSFEPTTIVSEITGIIPTTILYENGNLEQIKGTINATIKVV